MSHEITPSSIEQHEGEYTQAAEKAATFLSDQVPVLSRLTGLNVDVSVGSGWATDLETGSFTIDPSYFADKGYSADHIVHTTMHELMAHVRDAVRDPVHAARQVEFTRTQDKQLAKARHLFNNILTDIHGDKLTGELLPAMKEIGVDIYSTRLFPLEQDGKPVDYASLPMHIQLMYKIIRQEMVPGSDTPVRSEVDAAITRLRDYEGSGFDAIAYLTTPNKKLPGSDRFDQQLAVIWPEYEQLLELDKQETEERKQQQSGESSEQQDGQSSEQNEQSQPQNGESQDSQSSEQRGEPQNSEAQPGDSGGLFDKAYDDYFENKHPEPMSHEEHEKLDKAIKNAAKKEREKQYNDTKTPEQRAQDEERQRQRQLDKTLREQTGHSLAEHRAYDAEMAKWPNEIEHMREVFRSVLSEVVATRRGLSRRAHTDGDLLDPRRLAQTITDIKSGVPEPKAFQRYERVRGRTELVGKTDYIFVFDCSQSMQGKPAQAAAASAVIMLEALAGMERDIKATEEEHGISLDDFDIRTGLYAFGTEAKCLKELSSSLSDRERIDAYQACQQDMGGTSDFLALEAITALPVDADRKRVVIVVSDGESHDKNRARQAIDKLRRDGAFVYGIALGSRDAEQLYAPHAKFITRPSELPETLQTFIEETVGG